MVNWKKQNGYQVLALQKIEKLKFKQNFSCEVEFYYPADEDEFDAILEELKSKSRGDDEETANDDYETNVNVFGENSVRGRLIVFDDVSGSADNSKKICKVFDCCTKIQLQLRLYFSYDLPWKSKLANDFITNQYL